MALSIKDPEVDRMARKLARERQTTMTSAIKLALGNELNRGERFSPEERARRTAAIIEIQQQIALQGIDWSMTEDEILGYDENGLSN
jgi:antitoxin VapB